jgi:glycine dehydrogenase subunit 2
MDAKETESPETLDEFIQTMKQIAEEARTDPELVRTAPHNTAVRRLDEVKAAREPILTWKPK